MSLYGLMGFSDVVVEMAPFESFVVSLFVSFAYAVTSSYQLYCYMRNSFVATALWL